MNISVSNKTKMRITKKNSTIFLIAVAILAGSGVTAWLVTSDDTEDNSSIVQVEESTTNSEQKPADQPTIEESEESTSTPDDMPEDVIESTVALEEVEFQPIPADEDPDEIPKLPVTTNHYKIVQLNDSFFEIELYAILNKPEQYDEYQAQLAQFKQEALNYLVDNGYDAQTSRISYIPAEAAQL